MTTTGSPGLSMAQRRDEPPISRMISDSRPRSGSVQAPVSAIPSITSLVPLISVALLSKFCKAEELSRLEVARGDRRAHDDFDDGRREAVDLVHAGDETIVEGANELVPLRLIAAIEGAEELHDVWIAELRGGHRLDHVAGVLRMVVAVERDQLLAI